MGERVKRLKKQSDVSSKSPPDLVVFLDRSLGKRVIANALKDAGVHVELHDDHFAPDAKDEEWLARAGREGWIVFTKDDRIRYRTTERTALKKHKVRAVILTAAQLDGHEMAQIFIKALPGIRRLVKNMPAGFIVRLSRSGRPNLWE